MASKTKKSVKKANATAKVPRPLDEKTGYRVGSLGYTIGLSYLSAKTREEAVKLVEDVIKVAAKTKGKPTSEEYVHSRAISWIAYLKARDEKTYQPLPKVKEVAK